MASIKISDLQSTTSDWIELPSEEADSVYGGWRHRHRGQIAAHNLFSTVSSQIESISSIATQGGRSVQITIPNFSSNDLTATINGTQIETSGNLFFTDSGIAPIGGVPIPGQPGAYTF